MPLNKTSRRSLVRYASATQKGNAETKDMLDSMWGRGRRYLGR